MHAERDRDVVELGSTTTGPADPRVFACRLEAAETDLDEREQKALADGASADELADLADERDALAARWDAEAVEFDARAVQRDSASLWRDSTGSARDVRARAVDDDGDPGFADRFLSACDRDAAAGDRAGAAEDRARAAGDRRRAAEHRGRAARDRREGVQRLSGLERELETLHGALASRNIIGQAQGLLMARYLVDAEGAFGLLVRLSQQTGMKLRLVAARVVVETTSTDQPG